jgi:hypothetical protein
MHSFQITVWHKGQNIFLSADQFRLGDDPLYITGRLGLDIPPVV